MGSSEYSKFEGDGTQPENKCEFYDSCEFCAKLSFTCYSNGGGQYCGKYRLKKGGFPKWALAHF